MLTELLSNPDCLYDCFPPSHCLSLLVRDFSAAGGVCPQSYVHRYYSGLWPASHRGCQYLEAGDRNYSEEDQFRIKTGLCSAATERALRDPENCVKSISAQREDIRLRKGILYKNRIYFFSFQPPHSDLVILQL